MKKHVLESLVFLVVVFGVFLTTQAIAETKVFERTETNWDVEVTDQIRVGVKSFVNHDMTHKWIRYSVDDTPLSVEFRRFDNPDINAYRLQLKHINKNFFYWSRFEYRDYDHKENHLRYRPRIGVKTKIGKLGSPYFFIEPHYVVETKEVPLIMTYLGTKYKFNKFDIGLFVQGQSDDRFNMKRVFFGTEFLVKI